MTIKGVHATDEDLRTIAEWAAGRPEIDEVWLFGSRAKGTSRPDSDFDVGFVLAPPLEDGTDWALGNFLPLGGGWKADLVSRLGRPVSLEPIGSGADLEEVSGSRCVLIWWRAKL